MDKRGYMFLKVFINRFSQSGAHPLVDFLPKEDKETIQAIEIHSTSIEPLLKKNLNRIHYSWLQPFIQKTPPHLQHVFLACLSSEQQSTPSNHSSLKTTPLAKQFILDQLFEELKVGDHLPLEFLPENEFLILAEWTKKQLTDLGDYLGLFDLASEVRHIVNRNYLNNIYQCLSPMQLHYLKICLRQKEQLSFPKMGFDPTKEDCPKLKQMIHRRGLLRLGKALCGQHPDFIWHIAHRLDRGRGTILLKEYQPEEIPRVTLILKQQLLNLITFLRSQGNL